MITFCVADISLLSRKQHTEIREQKRDGNRIATTAINARGKTSAIHPTSDVNVQHSSSKVMDNVSTSLLFFANLRHLSYKIRLGQTNEQRHSKEIQKNRDNRHFMMKQKCNSAIRQFVPIRKSTNIEERPITTDVVVPLVPLHRQVSNTFIHKCAIVSENHLLVLTA